MNEPFSNQSYHSPWWQARWQRDRWAAFHWVYWSLHLYSERNTNTTRPHDCPLSTGRVWYACVNCNTFSLWSFSLLSLSSWSWLPVFVVSCLLKGQTIANVPFIYDCDGKIVSLSWKKQWRMLLEVSFIHSFMLIWMCYNIKISVLVQWSMYPLWCCYFLYLYYQWAQWGQLHVALELLYNNVCETTSLSLFYLSNSVCADSDARSMCEGLGVGEGSSLSPLRLSSWARRTEKNEKKVHSLKGPSAHCLMTLTCILSWGHENTAD